MPDFLDKMFLQNWINLSEIELGDIFIALGILALELLILYLFIGPVTRQITKHNETKRWAETRKRCGAHLFAAIDDAIASVIYSVKPYKDGIAIARHAVETNFNVKDQIHEVRDVIELYAPALNPQWVNHVASMSSILWQMGRLGSSLQTFFDSLDPLDEADALINDEWRNNAIDLNQFEIGDGHLGSYYLTSDKKADSRLSFAAHISYVLKDAVALMKRHNAFMLSTYSLNETITNPYYPDEEMRIRDFIDLQNRRLKTIKKIQTSLMEGRFYYVVVSAQSSNSEEFAKDWSDKTPNTKRV